MGEYDFYADLILFVVYRDCLLQLETIWADGSGKYFTEKYRLVTEDTPVIACDFVVR